MLEGSSTTFEYTSSLLWPEALVEEPRRFVEKVSDPREVARSDSVA